MRVAYIDCVSGLAGDMLLGALIDAGAPLEALRQGLAGLGCGTTFDIESAPCTKGALAATRAKVRIATTFGPAEEDATAFAHRLAPPGGGHAHPHPHGPGAPHAPGRKLADVVAVIRAGGLSPRVAQQAEAVYRRLAEAEARCHGEAAETVHFHEVGALDAIADICGSLLALELLGVERVFASEAVLGRGTIRSAHGLIPSPGPATLRLLEGIPTRTLDIAKELTTPTGAALLAAIPERHGPMPALTIRASGYGAGKMDLPTRPNVCRVIVGDLAVEEPRRADSADSADSADPTPREVLLLEANLDDTTPELLGLAIPALLAAGALDAWASAIVMKRGRPAVMLAALCEPSRRRAVEAAFFRETSTFGVRVRPCDRTILARELVEVETPLGRARVKLGRLEGRVVTATPELRDCEVLAAERGVPVRQVYAVVAAAAVGLLPRP